MRTLLQRGLNFLLKYLFFLVWLTLIWSTICKRLRPHGGLITYRHLSLFSLTRNKFNKVCFIQVLKPRDCKKKSIPGLEDHGDTYHNHVLAKTRTPSINDDQNTGIDLKCQSLPINEKNWSALIGNFCQWIYVDRHWAIIQGVLQNMSTCIHSPSKETQHRKLHSFFRRV